MASGGVYRILSAEGKMDRVLMARELLSSRLKKIHDIRLNTPAYADDEYPTIADVEQTHVFFPVARFKPFVQVSFEYQTNLSNAGTAAFGSQITFDLNQVGEFIGDVAVYVKIAAPSFAGGLANARYRWCDYPGERLLEKVQFEVNGNPMDDYDYNAYIMHREYFVKADKLPGWKRCVGHEEARSAYFRQSMSNPAPDVDRCGVSVYDGHQTYKPVTAYNMEAPDTLEMAIPILLWFCLDYRNVFPSISIPQGGRRLTVRVADYSHLIAVRGFGALTDAAAQAALIAPTITQVQLFVNHLFIPDFMHDIVVRRVAFTLIRVHRTVSLPVSANAGELSFMSSFKWPIEYFAFGIRPRENEQGYLPVIVPPATAPAFVGRANVLASPDMNMWAWHKFSKCRLVGSNPGSLLDSAVVPATIQSGVLIEVERQEPHISTLEVKVNGNILFQKMPNLMYNSYMPYVFGRDALNTAQDPGLCFINFAIFPGANQPSGHINTSRSREFYVNYESSYINNNPLSATNEPALGTAIAVASALNFAVTMDGSMSLRYAT
jgi:hypothetical protein